MNKETWLETTRELFAYAASFEGVKFMTCYDYVQYLNQTNGIGGAQILSGGEK
jgi:hypothetical protein